MKPLLRWLGLAAAALLAIVQAVVTDLRFRGAVLAALPWVPGVVLCTQQKDKELIAPLLLSWLGPMAPDVNHLVWVTVAFLLNDDTAESLILNTATACAI